MAKNNNDTADAKKADTNTKESKADTDKAEEKVKETVKAEKSGTAAKDWAVIIEKAGLYIICGLAVLIAFWLSLVSMLHTVAIEDVPSGQGKISSLYYIREYNESVIYGNDSFFMNIIWLLLSIAALYILSKKLANIKLKYKLMFTFGWTALLGVIWVLSSQSAPTYDSLQVVNAATEFANDNFSILNNDDHYFKDYSFQLGYVFFLEITMRFVNSIFKPINPMYLEVMNAFFLAGINTLIVLISHTVFKDKRMTTAVAVMLALSTAPIISCSFIYGIFPGMFFAALALYAELRYFMDDKKVFGVIWVLSIAFAMMLKPNYLIWLIAMCIIAVVMLMKRKKYVFDCIFLCAAVILSMTVQPVIKNMYEDRSGIELGDSIPYAAWIAMGLCEAESAPGWFNYTHTVLHFQNHNYNADEAGAASKKVIAERVGYFIKNPQYTHDFFYKKIASQWNDTSYESIWNNTVRGQYKEKNQFASWVCKDGEKKVKKFMDIWAQLMFVAFTVGTSFILKKKNFPAASFALIFLGGFFYQIISEGKSQYIVPYIIVMTGIAGCGLIIAGDKLTDFVKNKLPELKKAL